MGVYTLNNQTKIHDVLVSFSFHPFKIFFVLSLVILHTNQTTTLSSASNYVPSILHVHFFFPLLSRSLFLLFSPFYFVFRFLATQSPYLLTVFFLFWRGVFNSISVVIKLAWNQ